MNGSKFLNEEEIKAKILLPYIKDLGFNIDEITLEETFEITLGNNKYVLDSSNKKAKGRLDLLCHRNGRNLILFELKRESLKLTKDDRNQGISYARLLQNIPPFVIVTNGKDIKVYDSISTKEIEGENISSQSSFWKNDGKISFEDELGVRYQALKNFVSFSDENLKIFCEKQVHDRLGSIVGTKDDVSVKFVPDLFIKRRDVDLEFQNFIESNYSVFAIVGNSGVGKTNVICDFCYQYLDKKIVLFYNAGLINKSILELISSDLNIFFSSLSDKNKVLNKLDEFAAYLDKDVIIFIDAIDESSYSALRIDLSEIGYALKSFDRIKFCLSCKKNVWSYFLEINSNDSYLKSEIFPSNNSKSDVEVGYHLEEFSSDEFEKISKRYIEEFDLKGDLSHLKSDTKNGFFLRVLSQVYQGRKLPSSLNEVELIWKYLSYNLKKIKDDLDPDIANELLKKIGKILIEEEHGGVLLKDYRREPIGSKFENIKSKLGLNISQNIPQPLFDRNILAKVNHQDYTLINFYFSTIRDYIICYKSYSLQEKSDQELRDLLPSFFKGVIGFSAIQFYCNNASPSHKQIIKRYVESRLIEFVEKYTDFLNVNFPFIKYLFPPFTKGKIGLLIANDFLNKKKYSFIEIPSNKKSLLIKDDDVAKKDFQEVFEKFDVQTVYWNYEGLLLGDVDTLVKNQVFSHLQNIVREWNLEESTSTVLNIEKLANILYFYPKKLGLNLDLKDKYYPRYQNLFPIDLYDILFRVKMFFASEHFKPMFKIEKEAKSSYRGTKTKIVSYDWDKINAKAVQALMDGTEIPKPNISGSYPPFIELEKILEALIQKGMTIIKRYHLPYPDVDINEVDSKVKSLGLKSNWIPNKIDVQFSFEQKKRYIDKFFTLLDKAYQEIVDACFPTLKNSFKFYNTLPHEYHVTLKKSNNRYRIIGYIHTESTVDKTQVHFTEKSYSELSESNIKYDIWYGTRFNRFINDFDAKRIQKGIQSNKVNNNCIIRSWVYKKLKEDLNRYITENSIDAKYF